MLYEFIVLNRDAIISRARERIGGLSWPSGSHPELESQVPVLLSRLSDSLRLTTTDLPITSDAVGAIATMLGGALLDHVIHDYNEMCQAISEIALKQNAPLTIEEFNTLDRWLDEEIAKAVTDHVRIRSETRSSEASKNARITAAETQASYEAEHLDENAAHELRNSLNTAILAFHAMKGGAVGIHGRTGAVLGRSLVSLQHIINRTPFGSPTGDW